MKLTEDGQNIYINYGKDVTKDIAIIKDRNLIDFVVANDWGYTPEQLCIDVPDCVQGITEDAFKRVDSSTELYITLPVGFTTIHKDTFSHFKKGGIELQFGDDVVGFICSDDEYHIVVKREPYIDSAKFVDITDSHKVCFNGKVREITLLNTGKVI